MAASIFATIRWRAFSTLIHRPTTNPSSIEAIAPRATGRECIGVYKYTSWPSVRPGRCLADFQRPSLPVLSVGFGPLPQRYSGQGRAIVFGRTNTEPDPPE